MLLLRYVKITYGLLICIVWSQGTYSDSKYNFCKDKGCVTEKHNGNGNRRESDKITENADLYNKKKAKEKAFNLDAKEKRNKKDEISTEGFNKFAIKRNDENKSEAHDKTRRIVEQIRSLQEQLEYLNGNNEDYEKCSKANSKGNCKNNGSSVEVINRGKKNTNGKKYKVELTPLHKTNNGDNETKSSSEKIYKKYRRIRSERKSEKQNKREALFKNWKTFKRITTIKPAKFDKSKWMINNA